MSSVEAKEEMERLANEIDAAITELRACVERLARSEHTYRFSKAKAWAMTDRVNPDGSRRLAAEIECSIDEMTADLRYERDLAEGLRQVALEAVRSKRQQLSAWQTWLAADRAEAEFVRTA